MQIKGEDYTNLLAKAEEERSFKCLVPYRNILTRWQRLHPEDMLRIAAIGSHRLDHHIFCTTDGTRFTKFDQNKCDTINIFIKDCELASKTGQTSMV